jgi:hypothetical protein
MWVVMNEDQIREFLGRLGRAVSSGDLGEITSCWAVPGIVVSDKGAIVIENKAQIEGFFAQAINWYRSQGIFSTKPVLERAEALSEKLTSVDVRWPGFDESGIERQSERSHYVLQLERDGLLRIRVALSRTTEPQDAAGPAYEESKRETFRRPR